MAAPEIVTDPLEVPTVPLLVKEPVPLTVNVCPEPIFNVAPEGTTKLPVIGHEVVALVKVKVPVLGKVNVRGAFHEDGLLPLMSSQEVRSLMLASLPVLRVNVEFSLVMVLVTVHVFVAVKVITVVPTKKGTAAETNPPALIVATEGVPETQGLTAAEPKFAFKLNVPPLKTAVPLGVLIVGV